MPLLLLMPLPLPLPLPLLLLLLLLLPLILASHALRRPETGYALSSLPERAG